MAYLTLAWKGIRSIAKKIPRQVYACAGLAIAITIFGWVCYQHGKQDTLNEWRASIERGRAAVERLKLKQIVVKTEVQTLVVEHTKTIKVKGDEIIKQIPIYIPIDTPDLPGGFRLLHDAAATNTPISSGHPPGETVPVKDATETVSQNYGQCLIWREKLLGWQLWYQQNEVLLQQYKQLTSENNKDNEIQ